MSKFHLDNTGLESMKKGQMLPQQANLSTALLLYSTAYECDKLPQESWSVC